MVQKILGRRINQLCKSKVMTSERLSELCGILSKELLAFLVDRKGAFCSNSEIIAALWEDEGDSTKKSFYLRDLKADLLATFTQYGAESAIRKQRGVMSISLDKIGCDYYDWMQGDIEMIAMAANK